MQVERRIGAQLVPNWDEIKCTRRDYVSEPSLVCVDLPLSTWARDPVRPLVGIDERGRGRLRHLEEALPGLAALTAMRVIRDVDAVGAGSDGRRDQLLTQCGRRSVSGIRVLLVSPQAWC